MACEFVGLDQVQARWVPRVAEAVEDNDLGKQYAFWCFATGNK